MIKQKENEKRPSNHIETSSKEEALKLFEEQKDDLESVDSDIYIKGTEWAENEIEEMNISK